MTFPKLIAIICVIGMWLWVIVTGSMFIYTSTWTHIELCKAGDRRVVCR